MIKRETEEFEANYEILEMEILILTGGYGTGTGNVGQAKLWVLQFGLLRILTVKSSNCSRLMGE